MVGQQLGDKNARKGKTKTKTYNLVVLIGSVAAITIIIQVRLTIYYRN